MSAAFQTNQIIHGFRVQSVREDGDPEGRAIRMVHEKTGASLFWLDNNAENMVFSITFRTLPDDNTGVFHILEHSVLCGSRDYPLREPFVELLKSSMSTFLNAMTFPDMTMYPVSSRNPRDLMNLTRVYLDAVFHPVSMTDRKRFFQEGWHIERDEAGNPEFRGVVYNEMKGSMSDPDTLMDRQIIKQLFPDTSYGYNSGGDPEWIPDLTWEEYKEKYRACYHPSNAYVYLDGKLPIEEMLELIDRFFSEYEKTDKLPSFAVQTPKASEETICYEVGPEEEITGRSHFTMARITGTWCDRAQNLGRGIICDVLTGNNESPLKHAALEKCLCQDLNISVDDTGYQSWISIHADNIRENSEPEIIRLLDDTGRQIMRDGLDRQAVEASMNRLIYNMREDEEPQGIGRCIRAMSTWLYGGDPAEALATHQLIRILKDMIESGELNRLAADMLLNREGLAVLHSHPSREIGRIRREEENRRLQQIISGWTEEERAENERLNEELSIWQQTPDGDDELRKLPMLTRQDADIIPEWTGTEMRTVEEVPVMIHRIPCNGVVHIRMYFSLTDLTEEELTRASLFAGMLGRLPTTHHNALNLQQEINRWTGSMGFAVSTRCAIGDDRSCVPYLTAFVSALEENTDQALGLLEEVLLHTRTEGQEDRIFEFMNQNELTARQRIVSAGHLIAVKHVLSQYSADGAARNALDGEPAIRYIHRFATHPDETISGFTETAQKVLRSSICRKRLTVSITGTKEADITGLIRQIPEGIPAPEAAVYTAGEPVSRGFRIPAQIGFAARGYRLSRCGMDFSGVMWLASNILTLGYLWNKVRVQGGAYGAGFQTDRNGNVFSYSFRDPTPGKTLSADYEASEYLKAFVRNGENLDKYIISSLNELNPLLSPRDKGALADARQLTGYKREDAEKIRKDILEADGEDLIRCGEWLDRFARDGCVCVAAPQEELDECGELEITEL